MKWFFLLLVKVNWRSVLTFGACLPLNVNGEVHDEAGLGEALLQILFCSQGRLSKAKLHRGESKLYLQVEAGLLI